MSVLLDNALEQMLEVSNPVPIQSVVVSAWVLPTDLVGRSSIFSQLKFNSLTPENVRLYHDDLTVGAQYQHGFGDSTIAEGPDLVEDQWNHVLMRNDTLLPAFDFQLAVDDVAGALVPNSTTPQGINRLQIGGYKPQFTFQNGFKGHIAEVAVYGIPSSPPFPDPILSVAERTLLSQGARPDTVAIRMLHAYWPMLINGNDAAGARHLTSINGPSFIVGVHPPMFNARTVLNYERGTPGIARGNNRGMAA